MLGSHAKAEDVVQETYVRWPRAVDRLRALKIEREAYSGPWLPEPLINGLLSVFDMVRHLEAIQMRPFTIVIYQSVLSFIALALSLAACAPNIQRTADNAPLSTPADVGLSSQFRSDTVDANGVTLRYVRGGDGPAVILVHGFPQDWSAWRHVMPLLARRFTVVAVDLRGVGGSKGTGIGFDGATLAADLHELANRLQLDRPYIVGHDIGGMPAYAYARAFPEDTRGVMILDFPLPGIAPWAEVERDPILWHFEFHQTPRLPEALLAGRQALYFRDFLDRIGGNSNLFSDADVARFAKAYESPASLRAGLEFYRSFPETARWNASQNNVMDVPIVLAGGDRAVGPILETGAADLRDKGARNVTVEIIADSGHWVAEEKPENVAALIARHAGRSSR